VEKLTIVVRRLVAAGEPFTSGDTVDEVSGTIPLMDEMKAALEQARQSLADTEEK